MLTIETRYYTPYSRSHWIYYRGSDLCGPPTAQPWHLPAHKCLTLIVTSHEVCHRRGRWHLGPWLWILL